MITGQASLDTLQAWPIEALAAKINTGDSIASCRGKDLSPIKRGRSVTIKIRPRSVAA